MGHMEFRFSLHGKNNLFGQLNFSHAVNLSLRRFESRGREHFSTNFKERIPVRLDVQILIDSVMRLVWADIS